MLENLPIIKVLVEPNSFPVKLQALFNCLATKLPADAFSYLEKKHDALVPVAAYGLAPDVLGRRFKLVDQPRLKAFCEAESTVRFEAGCELPDPFDGLIPGQHGKVGIHDCLGCRVVVDDTVVGVFTMDCLDPDSFSETCVAMMEPIASLIASLIRQDMVKTSGAQKPYQPSQYLNKSFSLIGNSKPMLRLHEKIDTVASSDLSVLICGETGTGKELVAHEIHARSLKASEDMVYVNCAALPEQLAESELFGHLKGAFTGAVSARKGLFEAAHKSTIFLDELGELSLAVQAKLLRVIQTGEIQRIGSDQRAKVDVRIIAATNRDLDAMIEAGEFRSDLFYRLNAFPIELPPLRERGQDTILLAGYFCELNRAQLGLRNIRMSPEVEASIASQSWPGNIRELEHAIARASVFAISESVHGVVTLRLHHFDTQHIQSNISENSKNNEEPFEILSMTDTVKKAQAEAIKKALKQTQGNWRQAAVLLDVDSSNLRRLARRLGII